jgi:hypothetical protein
MGERSNSSDPAREAGSFAETEEPCDVRPIDIGPAIQGLQKTHKRNVTSGGRMTCPPEIGLPKFLRHHLEIVELVARPRPHLAKLEQHCVVSLSLLPP